MKKSGFLLLIALVTISTTHAQTVKINTTEGTAIKGYDAVAYFMHQKAMPGDKYLLITGAAAIGNLYLKQT